MHLAFRMGEASWCALWLAFGTAFAQRVEGDVVAGARGLYEAEVKVNGQGEAERNAALRARACPACWPSSPATAASPSLPGVGQELRHATRLREELRLPPGRRPLGHGRAHVQHDAGRPLRPGSRSTASPPRSACRCGPSRAPSPSCGWRSTTAAGRAWSRWRRPTPRAPCSIARRNAAIASACPRAAPPNKRPSAPSGAATRPPIARAVFALQPADAADRQALPREGRRRLDRRLDLRRLRQGAVDLDRHRSPTRAARWPPAPTAPPMRCRRSTPSAAPPPAAGPLHRADRRRAQRRRLHPPDVLPAGPAGRARHGAGARAPRRPRRRTGADHRHAGPASAWSPTATCCWPKKAIPSCTCADGHRSCLPRSRAAGNGR